MLSCVIKWRKRKLWTWLTFDIMSASKTLVGRFGRNHQECAKDGSCQLTLCWNGCQRKGCVWNRAETGFVFLMSFVQSMWLILKILRRPFYNIQALIAKMFGQWKCAIWHIGTDCECHGWRYPVDVQGRHSPFTTTIETIFLLPRFCYSKGVNESNWTYILCDSSLAVFSRRLWLPSRIRCARKYVVVASCNCMPGNWHEG